MNKVLSAINTSLEKAEVSRQRIAALVTPEVGRPITYVEKYLKEVEDVGEVTAQERYVGNIVEITATRIIMNVVTANGKSVSFDHSIPVEAVRPNRPGKGPYGGFFALVDYTGK